jgi:hypothetical protein
MAPSLIAREAPVKANPPAVSAFDAEVELAVMEG